MDRDKIVESFMGSSLVPIRSRFNNSPAPDNIQDLVADRYLGHKLVDASRDSYTAHQDLFDNLRMMDSDPVLSYVEDDHNEEVSFHWSKDTALYPDDVLDELHAAGLIVPR